VSRLRPDIPPHVADIIRHLHPDLKRRVKAAIQTLSQDPELGEPLKKELEGLWKYRVRRFRIVYAVDRAGRVLRVLAVGARQRVYEDVVERIRRPGAKT
jgi:mRNA interferase RelE/StbE